MCPAGSTAVINCPLGLTYESIIFQYSGVTLAQIKDLRVVVNGKVIQEYDTADQLDKLNQYYGRGRCG